MKEVDVGELTNELEVTIIVRVEQPVVDDVTIEQLDVNVRQSDAARSFGIGLVRSNCFLN